MSGVRPSKLLIILVKLFYPGKINKVMILAKEAVQIVFIIISSFPPRKILT